MYSFNSKASYSNGQTVNEVLEKLQRRYKFLDKFDEYASSRLNEFDLSYSKRFPKARFNNFLKRLFRDYLISRIHGIQTKDVGISFIDTGLMITSTKVTFYDRILTQLEDIQKF